MEIPRRCHLKMKCTPKENNSQECLLGILQELPGSSKTLFRKNSCSNLWEIFEKNNLNKTVHNLSAFAKKYKNIHFFEKNNYIEKEHEKRIPERVF